MTSQSEGSTQVLAEADAPQMACSANFLTQEAKELHSLFQGVISP